MKVAFIMTWLPNPIDPCVALTSSRGLTGSEISFFSLATEIRKLGHEVHLFSDVTSPGEIMGIMCEHVNAIDARRVEKWDVAIAWIDPKPLQKFQKSVKKIFNQQVNDFPYCVGWETYVDVITSPSITHKMHLKGFTNFSGAWEVLPNGVDRITFYGHTNVSRRPPKMVYASSPDRGLHWLLEAFPQIKRSVPEATLDVYYDWRNFYDNVRSANHETAHRLRYCKEMFDRLKDHGVTHHMSVSRSEIADVYSRARVLAYPCDPVSFTEGFSVTTLEAAISGCVPVIVGADALGEIYSGYVPVVNAPYNDNKGQFIEWVIKLLSDDVECEKWKKSALSLLDKFEYNVIAKRLEEILKSCM